MSETVTKTITTALWVYETPEGNRRIAYHGEQVELTAAEAERGENTGVFNQPPAGSVTSPDLPHEVLADNFANVYDAVESRVPTPAGDDSEIALLNHDIRPPAPDSAAAEGDSAGDDLPAKPDAEANKPELVTWVFNNVAKADGSDYSKSELAKMKVDDLRAIIESVD